MDLCVSCLISFLPFISTPHFYAPVGDGPVELNLIINAETHVLNDISRDALHLVVVAVVEAAHVRGEEHVVDGRTADGALEAGGQFKL